MLDRRLLPREHGAYAELFFPLASGLIVGGISLEGAAFTSAAALLFAAHEPAYILLGGRGGRLQREMKGAARGWLLVAGTAGAASGAVGLAIASPAARLLAAIPASLALILVPLVVRGSIKTLRAEMLVAAALAAVHLPIAAAGAAEGMRLWAPALLWWVVFSLAVLEVHAIKDRLKRRRMWRVRMAGILSAAVVTASVLAAVAAPQIRWVALAMLVPAGAVLVVHLMRVHPRSLKQVGWIVVAADGVALLFMI